MDSLKEDHKEFIKHYEVIVKAQQRFRSEKHVFTEEIDRIALSSNDGKRMQSISSIETYTYGMSNDLVCKKKEINVTINKKIQKCLTLITLQKKI